MAYSIVLNRLLENFLSIQNNIFVYLYLIIILQKQNQTHDLNKDCVCYLNFMKIFCWQKITWITFQNCRMDHYCTVNGTDKGPRKDRGQRGGRVWISQ